jgi:cell division protein FtsL
METKMNNIAGVDTTKTIETSGNFVLEVLDKLGMWKAIIFLFFVTLFVISAYIVIVYIKKFAHRKEYNQEKERIRNDKDKITQLEKALIEASRVNKRKDEIIKTMLANMQYSISIEQISLLLDTFIGIERNYIQEIKSKLFYYLEKKQKTKDDYMYMYYEADSIFKQRVLGKLKARLFKDYAMFHKIEKDCGMIIKDELDEIKKQIDTSNTNVKNNVDARLLKLAPGLKNIILNNYKNHIIENNDIDYMRLE